MKYIMLRTKFAGCVQDIPIIFPSHLAHNEIAKVFGNLIPDSKPISAGTINSVDFDGEVSGASESLQLKSRPEDTKIIREFDYFCGMVNE